MALATAAESAGGVKQRFFWGGQSKEPVVLFAPNKRMDQKNKSQVLSRGENDKKRRAVWAHGEIDTVLT